MQPRTRWYGPLSVAAVLVAVALPLAGTSMLHRNVGQLTDLAKDIVVARVVAVSDGLEDNVPYTEVQIEIDRTLKGEKAGVYTFRQFGLLQPRPTADGMVNVLVTLPGWPQYRAGERVMLFLYDEASMTGLRTTVGLLQGKFNIEGGQIVNGIMNEGLFNQLSVPESRLNAAERAMLASDRGPVSSQAFISFVEKSVDEGWFSGIDLGPVPRARASEPTPEPQS